MNYNCDQCKKIYSSYQSFWIHNKKFHKNTNIDTTINTTIDTTIDTNITIDANKIKCNYCNKYYKTKYILTNHLKICHFKKHFDKQNLELLNLEFIQKQLEQIKSEEIKLEQIKLEQIKEEKELLKLKLKSSKSTKTSNNIKITNNLLQNNNFNIISIGREDICDILTQIEKKEILDSRYSCLEKIVDLVHCGKYNQFKNIIITNLKDKYAYKYDNNKKKFICIDKDEAISDLIDERLENIRELYEELSTTNKINDFTKQIIKEFLDKMTQEDKYVAMENEKSYKNFRSYKEHKVKILIYNNYDKISKDLAIIFDKPFTNLIE